MQFIHPTYERADLTDLYDHPNYNLFVEDTVEVQDVHDPNTRHWLDIWKNQFISLGLLSWQEAFSKSEGRKPRFLDVGCGRGRNLVIFDELGFTVAGIDLSESQVALARERLNFDVKRISVDDFEPEEKFDCILAAHIIEHVMNPHEFISKLQNLLHDGGSVLIETPITDDWGNQRHRYRDIYHTLFFDHFTLALLGGMHGLHLMRSQNIVFRRPSFPENHIIVQALFSSKPNGGESNFSESTIRIFRAAFDGVDSDFVKYARDFLGHPYGDDLQSLIDRGVGALRTHGLISTLRYLYLQVLEYYNKKSSRRLPVSKSGR